MRTRAPHRGEGLLNGHCDKNDRKTARHSRWTLVKLAAPFLLIWWLVALLLLYVYFGAISLSIPSSELTKNSRDDEHKNERRSKKEKHRRNDREPDKNPVCTASPLAEKEAFPIYGCAEIEEMLQGETIYLGQGYWREVRLARYQGQDLAVKTLRDDQEESDRNRERHRWEAVAMDMVKDHPNMVHLMGLCECDLVTEYFPSYMDELLMGNDSSDVLIDLSTSEIIRMALEAARGIQALHEMPGGPVVHTDLQPRQLLLDENGVVKVNDLNRCRFMARDAAGEPCPFKIKKGNGVWRSPEEYAGEPLTEKLDIYSLGNIFWAMYGRRPPFPRDDLYKRRVMSGERPKVDPSWHPEFVKLFKDMWERDPKARPSAREVVVRLEKMHAELVREVQ